MTGVSPNACAAGRLSIGGFGAATGALETGSVAAVFGGGAGAANLAVPLASFTGAVEAGAAGGAAAARSQSITIRNGLVSVLTV